jgi:hypothetical protein
VQQSIFPKRFKNKKTKFNRGSKVIAEEYIVETQSGSLYRIIHYGGNEFGCEQLLAKTIGFPRGVHKVTSFTSVAYAPESLNPASIERGAFVWIITPDDRIYHTSRIVKVFKRIK